MIRGITTPLRVLSDDGPHFIDICLRDIANALGEEPVCNLEQVVVPGIIAKHMGNLARSSVFQTHTLTDSP